MKFIPERGIFFLHIPKNAGKSIHKALDAEASSYAAFAEDLGLSEAKARSLALAEPLPGEAPEDSGFDLATFGRVHPAHLPLFVIEEACPKTWACLVAAPYSFAMTRDPRKRFLSALMQRLKEFSDAGAIRADDPLVKEEAVRVCDWLSGRDRFADLEYVHFIPQHRFIEFDGQRVVKALFPVERTDLVSGWLQQETGFKPDIAQGHTRRQPKSWARVVQPAARFAARNLMTPKVKKAIYPYWTGSALFSNAKSTYDQISLSEDVEAFVSQYYARDSVLHQEAIGTTPVSAA